MEDAEKGIVLTSLGSEGRREIEDITSAATTCTTTTEGGLDRSVVIYVQQEQQELPVSLLTTAGSSSISTEQQLITLVPQVRTGFQVLECMVSLYFKIYHGYLDPQSVEQNLIRSHL
jgi:hypothetical protein